MPEPVSEFVGPSVYTTFGSDNLSLPQESPETGGTAPIPGRERAAADMEDMGRSDNFHEVASCLGEGVEPGRCELGSSEPAGGGTSIPMDLRNSVSSQTAFDN